VPEVTILATTYHEKRWITDAVFTSILTELSGLPGLARRPRLIVVTGGDDDDRNIREVFARFQPQVTVERSWWPPELTLLREGRGKRPALGLGMESVAAGHPRDEGVVVVMDADTLLQPGALLKVLPLFRLSPPVAAVTTNETGWVRGPAWFAEWIALRFGLRHRSMCSVSLSGNLLCLTGRLSAFRSSVITDPGFRAQVECDVIDHWLWGPFEMLSGDDKSTWYWLAARGQRMLYVPDAMATTIEVVQGSGVTRALANIRRWSGNSLRHSWRAIKLGPRKLGWFPWWSLLDQRLTMWTVLFGPAVAVLAIAAGRYEIAAGYLLWVLCSRLCHAAIAWRQGRRFSAYYVPLQVLSDWAVALTKLWVLFHPAKQNWLNRGGRTLDTTRGSDFHAMRTGLAHYLYGFSCAALVIIVGLFVGFLPLLREARLFLRSSPDPQAMEATTSQPKPLESSPHEQPGH
ncbi:MAG TPA: glycosyltransferase, partial [Candidatus Binatia bacterium]|nr:glycosyltransferase [Candidatus Binatia bacterium]